MIVDAATECRCDRLTAVSDASRARRAASPLHPTSVRPIRPHVGIDGDSCKLIWANAKRNIFARDGQVSRARNFASAISSKAKRVLLKHPDEGESSGLLRNVRRDRGVHNNSECRRTSLVFIAHPGVRCKVAASRSSSNRWTSLSGFDNPSVFD